MPTAPPIFTQVSLPSSLTKPAPYAAQELPDVARFNGSSLAAGAALLDVTGTKGFSVVGSGSLRGGRGGGGGSGAEEGEVLPRALADDSWES